MSLIDQRSIFVHFQIDNALDHHQQQQQPNNVCNLLVFVVNGYHESIVTSQFELISGCGPAPAPHIYRVFAFGSTFRDRFTKS